MERLQRHTDVTEMEFAEFYAATKNRCLRSVIASGLSPGEAEEALAEAYARAFARWSTVRGSLSPAAWVVRTAVNANISWWRRRRRERLDATAGEDVAVSDVSGSATDLVRAVADLPVRQREVVVLRYLLDLDTAQTAITLGMAPGTVTSHLHRALRTLREHPALDPTEVQQ
jgi:RNA polymerase sigma-70 factor (sigma-E family)